MQQLLVPPFGFLAPSAVVGGVALLEWGSNNVDATTNTFFAYPWQFNANRTGIELFIVAPFAMRLRELRVRAQAAGTGGGNTTFRVRVNGVNTALLVTITNNVSPYFGENLVDEVVTAPGDRVSLSMVSAGTITTSPATIYASLGVHQ